MPGMNSDPGRRPCDPGSLCQPQPTANDLRRRTRNTKGLEHMTDLDTDSALGAHFLRNTFHAEEYKLTYVATPKAACTTFKWWMASLLGVSREAAEYAASEESSPELVIHDALPALASASLPTNPLAMLATLATPGHFSFAIVRNPYTRLFSAWQSKILLREPLQVPPYFEKAFLHAPIDSTPDIADAFEQFLEHLLESEAPHFWDVHWTPQYDLLRPDLVPYTQVAKLESLGKLHQALTAHLGPSIPLPSSVRRTNESLIPFSRELLSERAIEIVRQLYARDFAGFDYPVEPPKLRSDLTAERVAVAIQAIQMIRGRHARLSQTRTHLSTIIATQEKDAEQLRHDLAAAHRDRELGLMEAENAHEQALAAVYASRSWRIAAPVRATWRMLRRLRNFAKRNLLIRALRPRQLTSALGRTPPRNTPDTISDVTLHGPGLSPGTMLIVADFLPLFDQASGGLRLKTLIDMIGEAGWTMVFGSFAGLDAQPGVLAASQGRARYEEPLRRAGVTRILYGADEIDAYLAASGPRLACAFLSFPKIAARFLPVVRSRCPNARVIYDMVDFHSVRLAREAALSADPTIREQAEEYRDIETACAAAADITLAVTEDEKSALLELVPDAAVAVLPNVFEVPTAEPPGPSDRAGLFFVGGFWHKPNSDAVRWFVLNIFPRLRLEMPDLTFSIAGSNAGNEVLALAQEPGVEVLGFVEDLTPLYQKHRVFVAPLRYGAGMKGKVGQSLAYGLPVVATPIGAEGMGLKDGVHLLVADDESAFAAQVLRLLRNDELWVRLSTAGREHILDRYSIEAVRSQLGAILRG